MLALPRPVLTGLALLLVVAGTAALPATAAPEGVPDRGPVLSESLQRSELVVSSAPRRTPSDKTVDGRVGDWKGQSSGIGGTSRLHSGEHIYTDFLFDDFGADDGDDADRLQILTPLAQAESRTARLDQLFQAAGDQFDAPRPVGAPDHYGDLERANTADLREVRWATDGDQAYLLARTTTLVDRELGVLVLIDRDAEEAAYDIGFGTDLKTTRFEHAVLLTSAGATIADLAKGTTRDVSLPVAIRPNGWTNALEAALPSRLLGSKAHVAVVAGRMTEGALVPANVAYRDHEDVAGTYNDKRQALALHAGNVDDFTTVLRSADLLRGKTQTVRPGTGYAERHMLSGTNISTESGENGIWQPYGLYVPSSYHPSKRSPLTFWLHYRGGKAHSGGAWTPRLITELGEEQGNIVVTPRGRGTSTWYVTEAHQDFFEVFADVHQLLSINPNRRYLSGYSMGGYGTYLFGLLYPDLFAGGYSTSGAMTQGAWTGEGPDSCASQSCYIEANEGDADAQNTYRILDNARHVPIVIHHGTDDELVPVTGIQRIGQRLVELGYRYKLTTFAGYEHYTQAIMDEWGEGATYLNSFTRERNPRDITYKVVPALVDAVNTVTANGIEFDFNPDGAYWADGLTVRDGDPTDPTVSGSLQATSSAIPAKGHVTLVRPGAPTPPDHSTPGITHGVEWVELGNELAVDNAFTASLTNLAGARFNVKRMGLDLAEAARGTVATDGDTTLVLTHLSRSVTVVVDGTPLGVRNGDAVLTLAAGSHTIELTPAE